jgi:hypothetical protein
MGRDAALRVEIRIFALKRARFHPHRAYNQVPHPAAVKEQLKVFTVAIAMVAFGQILRVSV